MAVGGLHMAGCQPVEIVRMAFDCCEAASQIFHSDDNIQLEVRIGLHCGSVMSGVVGTKKPQFSLFGDTVNTAARMQSTGEAMGVQMSQSIYDEWIKVCIPNVCYLALSTCTLVRLCASVAVRLGPPFPI